MVKRTKKLRFLPPSKVRPALEAAKARQVYTFRKVDGIHFVKQDGEWINSCFHIDHNDRTAVFAPDTCSNVLAALKYAFDVGREQGHRDMAGVAR